MYTRAMADMGVAQLDVGAKTAHQYFKRLIMLLESKSSAKWVTDAIDKITANITTIPFQHQYLLKKELAALRKARNLKSWGFGPRGSYNPVPFYLARLRPLYNAIYGGGMSDFDLTVAYTAPAADMSENVNKYRSQFYQGIEVFNGAANESDKQVGRNLIEGAYSWLTANATQYLSVNSRKMIDDSYRAYKGTSAAPVATVIASETVTAAPASVTVPTAAPATPAASTSLVTPGVPYTGSTVPLLLKLKGGIINPDELEVLKQRVQATNTEFQAREATAVQAMIAAQQEAQALKEQLARQQETVSVSQPIAAPPVRPMDVAPVSAAESTPTAAEAAPVSVAPADTITIMGKTINKNLLYIGGAAAALLLLMRK